MWKFLCGCGMTALVLGMAGGAIAYHTPDHFCEQCVYDNCSEGYSDNPAYLDCVSMACGDECLALVADRGSAGEGCMAQCEEMWQSCLSASEDSGGVIDDYCVETARSCYASCPDDSSIGFADDAYGESESP